MPSLEDNNRCYKGRCNYACYKLLKRDIHIFCIKQNVHLDILEAVYYLKKEGKICQPRDIIGRG